jgi:hypothetical protein
MRAADAQASAASNQTRPLSGVVARLEQLGRTAERDYANIHTGRPTKANVARLPSQKPVAPEKILQAFNTWAFKREQPDNPPRMVQVIAEATRSGKPVPFVLYWGKGPRNWLGEHDTACLDYLAALARRVRDVYEPGASFKLILTDTHAVLNGHSSQNIERYFNAVEAAARERGFEACWLGELVFAVEAADAVEASADEPVSKQTLEKLGLCAAKWFRGEGTPEEGAARYYQMNMVEKQAVQFAFPSSIFVTFNGSEYRCLFPERMPIFYMYSLKRGFSVKPWFLPADASPST